MRVFWVIMILGFFPYVARVDFKGLIFLNKVLEIGFGLKIPKLNFVSHLKISQENCRKNFLWPNIPKKVEKVEKP